MKNVRITDIAEKIGVSRNTVSKVINNRGYVSDHTREQVIETAIELGYKKIPAEWLSKNKTKNILVIATAPDFSNYWGEIMNGIINNMEQEDYNCFYHFLTPQQIKDFTIPEILSEGNISGIIVMNVYEPNAVKLLNEIDIPTVYFDIPLSWDNGNIQGDIITVEGRRSTSKITQKLIDDGLKNIGFIGDVTYCKSIYERWCGFRETIVNNGFELNKDNYLTNDPEGHFYCSNEINDQIDGMLSKNSELPEAFVCANDAIAYRLINKLEEKGYGVPDDIKVTGFDGTEDNNKQIKLFATVKVDTKYIGIRLAEQMIWRIHYKNRQYEITKIIGKVI